MARRKYQSAIQNYYALFFTKTLLLKGKLK